MERVRTRVQPHAIVHGHPHFSVAFFIAMDSRRALMTFALSPSPAADSTAATDTFAVPVRAPASPGTPSRIIGAERGDCWLTLSLRHAGPRTVRIGYECVGAAHAPAVVVLGGISADRHLAASHRYPEKGWWQAQAGLGRALDPQRFRLIGIDWLGADGSLDEPIDTADQADALAAVLDALGVRRLHALVGASYGAMVGLQFAARHGERVRRVLAISGTHRAHPFATAWRCVQRDIIRLAGNTGQRTAALSIARQLALLSYRTPEEFAQRFTAPAVHVDDAIEFAAQPYLRARGADFAGRFDATAFLRLSESIDLHSVEPTAIRAPTTLAGVYEDRLVPIGDLYALAEQLPDRTKLHALRSIYGHDAFLKETDAIDTVLRDVLDDLRAVTA
jgi:homoserine O-acetyltransferase